MALISDNPSPDTAKKSLAASNLSVRVMTALVFLPIALAAIFLGGWVFTILVGLLAAVGALEFYTFAHERQTRGSALIGVPVVIGIVLAFHFRESRLWVVSLALGILLTAALETIRHPRQIRLTLCQVGLTLAGVIYIAFPSAFLIAIRTIEPESDGLLWLLLICFATWGTDTFAYFGGRFFGKHKLAPVLSPKKTVEGAIVGVIGGILMAYVVLLLWKDSHPSALILITLAPLAAIWGDLFESAVKRYYHVKDSHVAWLNLFPGHGGVLDRVDSLIWVTTLFFFYLALHGVVTF